MIIIVCTDDAQLISIAQASIKKYPQVFGDAYLIYKDTIPSLEKNENLFVIAHGAFNDASGNPVIGDKQKDFYVNGIEFWTNIHTIFPSGYSGNVYIDACESADHDGEVFSFIEVFHSQFNVKFNGKVYGKNGATSGLISLPSDSAWKPAQQNSRLQSNGLTKAENTRRYSKLRSHIEKKRKYLASASVGASPSPANLVTLTVPGADPSNLEAVKYYTFNQTGNIMMSSTDLTSENITQSVRDVFNEVSVFFAAMTKAISTTINPVTKQPYSIYDYVALDNIISGSGLFVHVTEEDITYTTSSYGADFSQELIEGLLGLATGSGELSFAQAMIASMGSAGLEISGSQSSSDSKVANIIFVCEYLLGMPVVSAIVVYCDMTTNIQQVKVGPCFSETTVSTSWIMHKDTYMFVTPKFISQYAGDLLSVESDGTYNELVDFLSDLVLAKPDVTGVTIPSSSTPAPANLKVSTAYEINGENFGTQAGKVLLGTTSLEVGTWNNNSITFTTPATAVTTGALLNVFLATNTGSTPDASSQVSYTVGS